MKTLLLLIALFTSLSTQAAENWTARSSRVLQATGLEGCTYTEVETPFGVPRLHVIRCENSTTATSWNTGGKSSTNQTVTTIDTDVERAKEALKRAEALRRISPEDRKVLGIP